MAYLEKEDVKRIAQHIACNTVLQLPIVTPRFRARIWRAVRLKVGRARIESFVFLEGDGVEVHDGARIGRGTRILATAAVVIGKDAVVSRNCFLDTQEMNPPSGHFPKMRIFGPIVVEDNTVVPANTHLRPHPGFAQTSPSTGKSAR